MTKPRNWKKHDLMPIVTHKGGISLDPKSQQSEDKRARIAGRSPAHLRSK